MMGQPKPVCLPKPRKTRPQHVHHERLGRYVPLRYDRRRGAVDVQDVFEAALCSSTLARKAMTEYRVQLAKDSYNTPQLSAKRPGIYQACWVTRDSGTLRRRMVVTPDRAVEALLGWRPGTKRAPVFHRVLTFLTEVGSGSLAIDEGSELEQGNRLASDGEEEEGSVATAQAAGLGGGA
jgi:hypothetical protein